ETRMPTKRPTHMLPVTAAAAAAPKAAASILPSSPISKMPERSEKSPARQASSSGVVRRRVAASTETAVSRNSIGGPSAIGGDGFARHRFLAPARLVEHEGTLEPGPEQALHGAGEKDHQCLDDD